MIPKHLVFPPNCMLIKTCSSFGDNMIHGFDPHSGAQISGDGIGPRILLPGEGGMEWELVYQFVEREHYFGGKVVANYGYLLVACICEAGWRSELGRIDARQRAMRDLFETESAIFDGAMRCLTDWIKFRESLEREIVCANKPSQKR